jgi:hypothetical protein
MTLMRFDPFRELDRFTEQVLTGNRVSRTMPMEASTVEQDSSPQTATTS